MKIIKAIQGCTIESWAIMAAARIKSLHRPPVPLLRYLANRDGLSLAVLSYLSIIVNGLPSNHMFV
jgi:hypothetical protein